MAERRTRFTNDQAVRIFLRAQGFGDPRPAGRVDARHFARVVSRLRLVQIDSVNVLTRAHYLPVFARLGPYRREALDRWIYHGRHMFEYWCHEQSYAPVSFHPMMRPRMHSMRDHGWKRVRDLLEHDPGYVRSVLDQVGERGPIPARHLSDPGEKTGPWWGYGKGKVALAWLFATGQVAVARRINFERWYDRPERVLPTEVLAEPDPSPEEADRARVREAAGALGIATVGDLADYFRMKITPTARAVQHLASAGEFREVSVTGWSRPAYLRDDVVLPRARKGTALLCPFDPLVWTGRGPSGCWGSATASRSTLPRPDGSTVTMCSPSSWTAGWWAGSMPRPTGGPVSSASRPPTPSRVWTFPPRAAPLPPSCTAWPPGLVWTMWRWWRRATWPELPGGRCESNPPPSRSGGLQGRLA